VTLFVSGDETDVSHSQVNLSSIERPAYLKDTMNIDADSRWEIGFQKTGGGYDWIGAGKDCKPTDLHNLNVNCSYQTFGGMAAAGNRHFAVVNTVDELTAYGQTESPHTIHLHVNHFQLYSSTPPKGEIDALTAYYGRIGDWRDSIPIVKGKVVLRYNVHNFEGEMMLHCHFLSHEDRGMMLGILSQRLKSACTYPDGKYAGYCTSPAQKSGLHLSDSMDPRLQSLIQLRKSKMAV
jgi:hypothetical protein